MKILSQILFVGFLAVFFIGCSEPAKEESKEVEDVSKLDDVLDEDTLLLSEPDSSTYFEPNMADVHGIDSIGAVLLKSASLGNVKMGMSMEEVVRLAGEPEAKSEVEFWEVDADDHVWWYYADSSLIVEFSTFLNDEFSVAVIDVLRDGPAATDRGIKFGSSVDEIKEAYAIEMDLCDWKEGEEQILFGDAGYGGLFFTLCDGFVCAIKIGPILRC